MTSLEGYCPPTRPDAVIFRGAGAPTLAFILFILFLIRPTSPPPLHAWRHPRPYKCPMACPFDQVSDRHLTPPLSPSTSSGSSRESSAPSFSTCPSSHLPKDIDHLHSTYPDSQPLRQSNSVIELGRMPDGLEGDTIMLDEWKGDGKREERDHGKHILEMLLFRRSFHSWLPRFVELTCLM